MKISLALLGLAAVVVLSGCSSTRLATSRERTTILSALHAYEKEMGAEPISSRDFNPVIRVKGDAAWARYRKNRRRQQIASAPIVVELHKLDQNWTVTKEDQDWPWWWHVINHTVGVK